MAAFLTTYHEATPCHFLGVNGRSSPSNVPSSDAQKDPPPPGPDPTALAALLKLNVKVTYNSQGKICKINCAHTQVANSDLANIQKVAVDPLDELDLAGTLITDDGLGQIGTLKVNALKLRYTKLSDRGMSVVSQIANLTLLDLSSTNVSDQGVDKLAKLKLTTLLLSGTRVTATDFHFIGQALNSSLQTLDLAGAPVRDSALADGWTLSRFPILGPGGFWIPIPFRSNLLAFPNLSVLGLAGTKVEDAWTEGLQYLPELKVLSLSNTAVTGSGLNWTQNSKVRSLYLASSQIKNTYTRLIAIAFPNVKELYLGNTTITDVGLVGLQRLHGVLNKLDLSGTKVTDDGCVLLRFYAT